MTTVAVIGQTGVIDVVNSAPLFGDVGPLHLVPARVPGITVNVGHAEGHIGEVEKAIEELGVINRFHPRLIDESGTRILGLNKFIARGLGDLQQLLEEELEPELR